MSTVHRAWRWYFWASLILAVLALGFEAQQGWVDRSWGEILYAGMGYVMEVPALICLYGFAWQIRLGKRQYWVVFLFVNVAFFISTFGYAALSIESEFFETMGLGFVISVLLAGAVLTLPMFVANFLYAFRSKHIWAA